MQLSADADPTLLQLLAVLRGGGYRFVTPTPATHERVLARRGGSKAAEWRDAFGWNMPFASDLIEPGLLSALEQAGLVHSEAGLLKSRIRISSLGPYLFAHSAFPTDARDAVFFGPDSYRFVDFLEPSFRAPAASAGWSISAPAPESAALPQRRWSRARASPWSTSIRSPCASPQSMPATPVSRSS